jgi:prevent-host-death family protein
MKRKEGALAGAGRRSTPLTAFLGNCTVQLVEMESLTSTTPTATRKNGSIVVSVLRARANFGKLLNRIEDERRSLIIEKRGTPRAVLMSIRDYVKMAAPEPEVLRIIGEESVKKGTNTLTSRQIDQIIRGTRAEKKKH